MEHTPGPWKWRHDDSNQAYMIFKPHDGGIADVYYTTDDIPAQPTEGEANAKLIVAAPDLLQACSRLLHHMETGGKLVDGQDDPRIGKSIQLAKEVIARIQSN